MRGMTNSLRTRAAATGARAFELFSSPLDWNPSYLVACLTLCIKARRPEAPGHNR